MKKLSIFIILVIIIGAIFYFWPKDQVEDQVKINQKPDKPNVWTLNFEFSEEEIKDVKIENENNISLYEITKKICQGKVWDCQFEDYGDMGILVTKIEDKENGQNQKYWQYFVAGEQPQVSADKYFPAGGTHIEWKFIESEF